MRPLFALALACVPGFAQQKPATPSPAPTKQPQPIVAATDVGKPWPMAQDKLPTFPPLPAGKAVEGGLCHELALDSPRGPAKVWIYVPKDSKPKQAPCVLEAPAGSNLLFGMTLGDGDRPEHLPWLQAGFVVVAYEIDGVMPPDDQQTDANVMRQIRHYADSWAGMRNARAALEYALANVPAIDPTRLFAAGHSSAATTALLFAAHEPRLRGVAAFMPVVDVMQRIPEDNLKMLEGDIPGFRSFLARSSPHSHVANWKAPMFFFAAEDDGNTPFADTKAFVETLRGAKKDITFEHVATGNHYDPMLDPGLGLAIAWAKKLGPAATAAAAPAKQGKD
jgi:dienelactone hydrolase